MIIFGIAAICRKLQIFYTYLLITPLMLIAFLYKKKLIITVNNGEAKLFLDSGPVSLAHVGCILIFRKAGSSSGSGRVGGIPINVLRLISDKDDIITEIVLIDDDESYRIAYWMQSVLKVDIDDYMGRELETIPAK